MPKLDWIGKQAVVNHHREVPFHLLEAEDSLSVGDPGSGNMLVEGDNLKALKALLPYYAGQVKCIYIDPPYNTGKKDWTYSDNVDSPEIKRWIGQVVGTEAEDLCRHDKWLCMMYPRLCLLQEFMRDDGVIFISIGKDEAGHLRVLCDEVFGASCLLESFIWQIEGNVENQEAITATHEYVLAYERRPGASAIVPTLDPNLDDDSKLHRDFVENSVVKNAAANPASTIELPPGFPCAVETMRLSKHETSEALVEAVASDKGYIRREHKPQFNIDYPARLDDMVVEDHALAAPCRVYSGWQNRNKLLRFIETGCVPLVEEDGAKLRYFLSPTGVPTYRKEGRTAHFVETVLRNMGTTERTSNELERMGLRFSYPKPVELVRYLLSLYTLPGDVVMDTFAGSGTTGEAAVRLASSGRTDVKFILVEMERPDITAGRLRAVMEGYTAQRGRQKVKVEGLGGGFRYCKLGEELFAAAGNINPQVRYNDLARHLFFMETGEPLSLDPPGSTATDAPLFAIHNGVAYYLLYNGILKDKSPNGGNALTSAVLAGLPRVPDTRMVVFGTSCRLGAERLEREGVEFRHIPYGIRVG